MLTNNILMIRPVTFGFNEQTAESNAFQKRITEDQNIQSAALGEFDAFASKLCNNGINVIVINDTAEPHTPDSIFPNNWISFHEDGGVFLYPMQAENRRLERRNDIMAQLKTKFKIGAIHNLSDYEDQGKFLEGTGSMVFDRENKLAYACLSPRTNADVLNTFCTQTGYRPVMFHASDQNSRAIYHTNVMMCMGDTFVVICLDSVKDEQERALLKAHFVDKHKELIEISQYQLNNFAGNMLQLINNTGERLLIMSARAYRSLQAEQINRLENYCRIVTSDLDTIEQIGGGSARCMLAEVHLPLRQE